jgi:hypothetical protein
MVEAVAKQSSPDEEKMEVVMEDESAKPRRKSTLR